MTSSYGQLGLPPIIAVQPLGLSVQNGGTATFTVVAVSLLNTTFKWRLNDVELTGAQVDNSANILGLVSTLTVTNINALTAGDYSVQVVNSSGNVVSAKATLISLSSLASILSSSLQADGFHLTLGVASGSNYVISASTELSIWSALSSNIAPATTINFVDPSAHTYASRFYKVETR